MKQGDSDSNCWGLTPGSTPRWFKNKMAANSLIPLPSRGWVYAPFPWIWVSLWLGYNQGDGRNHTVWLFSSVQKTKPLLPYSQELIFVALSHHRRSPSSRSHWQAAEALQSEVLAIKFPQPRYQTWEMSFQMIPIPSCQGNLRIQDFSGSPNIVEQRQATSTVHSEFHCVTHAFHFLCVMMFWHLGTLQIQGGTAPPRFS